MASPFRPHRFSPWDGTQDPLGSDGDAAFDRLAEDVFQGWDFESALRRMLSERGRDERGRRTPGLDDMMQQLRRRRQQQLERFNLDNVFKDIDEKLDSILRTERQGIDERVDNATEESAKRIMDRIAKQRRRTLDDLPRESGGAIKQLREYEWMEPRAEQQFDDLLKEMQEQVLQTYFKDMKQSMESMTAQDVVQMREMIRDLNALVRQRLEGIPDAQLQSNYEAFKERWKDFFPNAPATFDEFFAQLQQQMAQMDSLMQSMSPEMRDQLNDLMGSLFDDPELQKGMSQLFESMEMLSPRDRLGQRYDFLGAEELPLAEAMQLMDRLQATEQLEQSLRDLYRGGQLTPEQREQLRELLGDSAVENADRIQEMTRRLQDEGVVTRDEQGLHLTARGTRKIGLKALSDLFGRLQRDRFGNHELPREGRGGERTGDTRPYTFGDAFDLDVQRTVMNAVRREAGGRGADGMAEAVVADAASMSAARGRGRPPRLQPDDFEVHRTDTTTRSSTVLMLDMSRSMPLRGYFYAAKKVAMALDSLIRTQYPRDSLHIIGFSDYAREIPSSALAQLSVNEYVYGTNLQHGLIMARRLLARDRSANKQILIVSDGEPTAHMEGGHAVFFYPPLPETVAKTLLEVKRCAQEDIIINTFMLESNRALVRFVDEMTKLNRGRAFFISPDRLGDYVLVDYVRARNAA